MATEPARTDLDRLLAQAGWLRGLARRLVADPEAAEDVVQDTWVSALRSRLEGNVGARSWLARVAGRLARWRQRSDQARRRRERSGGLGQPSPAAAEVVERAQLQRVLVEAVLSLEEPYRSTILLRYFEDLSGEEIARRYGIPGSTVRNRLRRGLAELRARLDRKLGDGARGGGPRQPMNGASSASRWTIPGTGQSTCGSGAMRTTPGAGYGRW